jgi:hypothetical protein
MSLVMMSSFFCSSSWTLTTPAAPRLPEIAPEATTLLIWAQAPAITSATTFTSSLAGSSASHPARSVSVVMQGLLGEKRFAVTLAEA